MNYFQFFPYTFYLPFILSDIICFDKEKKLTKFDKKSLFLFIKKLKPAIKKEKRDTIPQRNGIPLKTLLFKCSQ